MAAGCYFFIRSSRSLDLSLCLTFIKEDSLDFHIVPSAPQTVLEQDEAATSDTKDHHHKPFVELEMEGEAVPTEELPRKKRFGLWLNSAKHKTMALVYNLYHTCAKTLFSLTIFSTVSTDPTQYPHFSASPIWMMGSCYPAEPVTQSDQVSGEEMYYHPHFLDDFRSLLWFSYRRDFPCIEQSTLTTDTGWGCMLRTAQMMLSRVLLCKMLVLGISSSTVIVYWIQSITLQLGQHTLFVAV